MADALQRGQAPFRAGSGGILGHLRRPKDAFLAVWRTNPGRRQASARPLPRGRARSRPVLDFLEFHLSLLPGSVDVDRDSEVPLFVRVGSGERARVDVHLHALEEQRRGRESLVTDGARQHE